MSTNNSSPELRKMSVTTKLVIAAVLLSFAVIHALGTVRAVNATHVMKESNRAPAQTAHMYGAD